MTVMIFAVNKDKLSCYQNRNVFAFSHNSISVSYLAYDVTWCLINDGAECT